MFRIVSILCFVFGFVTSLAAQDCYIVVEDRMGIVDTASLDPVRSAACAIREVLPDSIKESFVVVEEGHYFPSDYFDSSNDALELSRFGQLSLQYSSLLFISRQTNRLGETRFKARLQLPRIEAYGCVIEGLTNILADQVAARMNESSAGFYVNKEAEGLDLLKSELDKAYNCCSLTENKSLSVCTSCDYGPEANVTNQLGFSELEGKILSLTTGGRFMKLKNLEDVVASRVQVPGDPIEVSISAKWKKLPGGLVPETFGPVQLTNDLKALRAEGGDEVKVRAKLFDHTNCSELQSTLANWSAAGFDYATAAYGEELIVLSIGGQTAVYSRLRSESPLIADYCEDSGDFIGIGGAKSAKVFLPVALVVREILKRALMGAINVFIDVGLSVTIEKVFHQVSDECEVNSWGAAWNRYRVTASGWQLFFTFADGFVNNAGFSIIVGGLEEATRYLLNPSSGASFNKGSPTGFDFRVFFRKFVQGCAVALIADTVVDLAKHAKRAVQKMRGNDLPESTVNELTGEVNTLLGFFFKYRWKGVAAWNLVYDVNIPPAIKVKLKDVSCYEKISTYLSTQNLNAGDVLASVQGASTTRRKIGQLGLDLDDINDLTGSFGHFLHSPGIHGVPQSQLINEFTPGANTGFTGVINFRHGEFSMAPSDITDISNSAFAELLPRNGGHAQLANSIFEETEKVAGFALHYVESGKLVVCQD